MQPQFYSKGHLEAARGKYLYFVVPYPLQGSAHAEMLVQCVLAKDLDLKFLLTPPSVKLLIDFVFDF